MGWAEVDAFFQTYVFGFIFTDIRREIEMASGGNLLAALGLLCYTEVLGGVDRGTWDQGQGSANFNAFLDRMGPAYQTFRQKVNVYKVFRCGMAHEYGTKQPCVVEMLRGGAPSGLYEAGGRLHFNVEAYFADFAKAARALHQEMQGRPAPALPTVK
jgi:hypothetical protein